VTDVIAVRLSSRLCRTSGVDCEGGAEYDSRSVGAMNTEDGVSAGAIGPWVEGVAIALVRGI
jgi:hypothetical protein